MLYILNKSIQKWNNNYSEVIIELLFASVYWKCSIEAIFDIHLIIIETTCIFLAKYFDSYALNIKENTCGTFHYFK